MADLSKHPGILVDEIDGNLCISIKNWKTNSDNEISQLNQIIDAIKYHIQDLEDKIKLARECNREYPLRDAVSEQRGFEKALEIIRRFTDKKS